MDLNIKKPNKLEAAARTVCAASSLALWWTLDCFLEGFWPGNKHTSDKRLPMCHVPKPTTNSKGSATVAPAVSSKPLPFPVVG